jgi:Zn finger protein HypA/HybF involved in hydrogenase expression
MTETKWATCINCLDQIDYETYEALDHVCPPCEEELRGIIDGTAERTKS